MIQKKKQKIYKGTPQLGTLRYERESSTPKWGYFDNEIMIFRVFIAF